MKFFKIFIRFQIQIHDWMDGCHINKQVLYIYKLKYTFILVYYVIVSNLYLYTLYI